MIVRGHEDESTPGHQLKMICIDDSISHLRDEDPKVCPYCGRRPTGVGTDVYSDDHVFMDAIGGKKTVRACKRCNDHFGGTFEAQNLKDTIIRISILLAQAGVAIAKKGLKWKNAVSTPEGLLYNLVLTTDGVQIESAKPFVERDPGDPKILHVTVNNDAESRKLLKQFVNPKKFALQGQTPGKPARTQESSFNLDLNKMVGLTALKMAVAASTLAFPDEVQSFSDARIDLTDGDESSRVKSVVFDHRIHSSLDASHDPLCHVIYLEEHEGTLHGVVQFFGSFQAYITLSNSVSRSYERGLLATLDPTTGQENFRVIPRLGIKKWRGNETADQLSPIKKFNACARQVGAKSDVLNVSSVTSEDGVERKAKWSIPGWSWTGDIPGRRK
ncbi:MAG: HNH endonuclease [Candidatus Sulfotelmatobacter sp.]